MAPLPSPNDIRRLPMPAASPDIRVGQIDYSPIYGRGGGSSAIATGMASLGKAAGEFATAQNEVDDYETKKRLIDFSNRAEQELEAYKRSMPVGGSGFAEGWQNRYRELAGEFVGEGEANIPAAQRGKIGLQLKQLDRQLHERAWRDEYAERDRHTIAGLEETTTSLRSRVEADPTRHDVTQAEAQSLIDLAPLTPAQRDAYKRKVKESLSEATAYAYAQRATSKAGLDEARALLAPHAPDRTETTRQAVRGAVGPTFEGQGGPASIRFNNPGAQYPGPSANKFGATRTETIGGGHKIAVFPDAVSGAAAQFDLLSNRYTGKTLGQAISTWSGGNSVDTYLSVIQRETGITRDTVITKEMMADPKFAIPLARAMATQEAGRQYPLGQADWEAAHAWATTGQRPSVGAPDAPGAGYMDAGLEPYAGPLASLPLSKRRAAYAKAEETYRKQVGDIQGSIREQMTASEKGVLPPEEWLRVVEPRVDALGDPETKALYATMLGKAKVTADFRAMPPLVQQIRAQQAREAIVAGGGTGEQEQFVAHMEKLAAETKAEVASNAIGWANRTQPVVPMVENPEPEATRLVSQGRHDEALMRFPGQYGKPNTTPINFAAEDIGTQLDRRMQTAQAVARYTGGQIQAFAANEREFLGNVLKKGGAPMLTVMGQIAAAAERANVDASMILKEVAPKDAPELAMIGHLVGSKADPRTLTVASEALKWRIAQGERFESSINKTSAQPSLGEYDKLFASAPTARDSLKSLANLVYEYEARQKGVGAQFDQTLYTDIVHRLMGQTTDPTGQIYGGVGWQGGAFFSLKNWTDGRSTSQILVPPQVRQDSFDDLVGALRADDLAKIGGMPKDAKGNAYSMGEIRNMSWQSVGPPGSPPVAGVYLLKVKEDNAGRPIYAMGDDGNPLVIDIRPMMGELQKRKPSIFAGYDKIAPDMTMPDPAYPTGYTPPKPTPRKDATREGDGATRTGRDRRSTMPVGATQ